jgi:hypothetical protein
VHAYIYHASLYCEPCGEAIPDGFTPRERIARHQSEDSNVWPQGPYPDGGGKADSPQHCDACGVFLRNPLTADGYAYARACAKDIGKHERPEWAEFYGIEIE